MSFTQFISILLLLGALAAHAEDACRPASTKQQCQDMAKSAEDNCDAKGALANKQNNSDATALQQAARKSDSTPDYSGAMAGLANTAAGRLGSAKQYCETQKSVCQCACAKFSDVLNECKKKIELTEAMIGSGQNGNEAAAPQAKDTQDASQGKGDSGGGGMPQMPQMPQQQKKDDQPQTPQSTASSATPATPSSNCSASSAFSGGSAPGCAETIATKCAGQFAGTNAECANYGQFQAQAKKICNAGQGSATLCQSINTQSVCADLAKSGQPLPDACNGGSAVSEGGGKAATGSTAAQSLNFGSAAGGGGSMGAGGAAAAGTPVVIRPNSVATKPSVGSLATEGGGGGGSSSGGSLPDLSKFSFGSNPRGPASAKKSDDGESAAISAGKSAGPVIHVPALSNIVAEVYHKKCLANQFLHCEGVK